MNFCTLAYARVEVEFTPSDKCETLIIDAINKAQSSIDVAIYSFTNEPIAEAIKSANSRGVKIRVLTDRTQAGGRGSKVRELYKDGVNIRVHSKHKIEHNKFAIFDNKAVASGSYNWTTTATKNNSENCLLITTNKSAIERYKNRFEYLWQTNTKTKSDEWFGN